MPNAMEWNNNSDLAIAILDQASKIVSMMDSLKAGDSFGRLVGLQISKWITCYREEDTLDYDRVLQRNINAYCFLMYKKFFCRR